MKYRVAALFFLFQWYIHAQSTVENNNRKIEDEHGCLITDPVAREAYFAKRQRTISLMEQQTAKSSLAGVSVPLCSNGTFEEFQSSGAGNFLKNFNYKATDVINPTQCRAASVDANLNIMEYNPTQFNVMATTVPANYLDEYIGNINAFDQFALKVNYKESSQTLSVVQGRRFKTDNETMLKLNYKTVLQSIPEGGHDNEQPFFKARVINNSGVVVSEYCLIGDVDNCIFSQAPNFESGSIILYTANWQSAVLDISSIPNNQDFTIEFTGARCGLGAHFGYAYIDDICLLHSNENLMGSVTLDPLNAICPVLPMQVCGSFTVPNSGGISATIASVNLNVRDAGNNNVYTSSAPVSLDLATKRFCFDLAAANLPDITTGTYNVSVTINFGIAQINCSGANFNSASDDDANAGWDIWFLNCTDCPIDLHPAEILLCDTDKNGKEFFNITNADALITTNPAGLAFTYFATVADAFANTNPILNFTNFETGTAHVFVRAESSPTCFKIIAVRLIVKSPIASISGILNVCSGSTVLTATPGTSYLWGTGETTQSISVSAVGTYTVMVTDIYGCTANGSATILNNMVAVQPTIVVTQPSCFVSTGSIEITSPASEYSYDGGATWETTSIKTNLPFGNYVVRIKTAAGCMSYDTTIRLVPFLSSFPHCDKVNPTFCGGTGSISVTTTAPYYSYDDGVTWTTSNSSSGLPAGIYLVRVKDAFGCISNFNSVNLESEYLVDPTYIVSNPYCGNPGSIEITTPASAYSFDGGVTWQTSNILTGLTSYSYIIKIKDGQNCTSSNVYVYLRNLESISPEYELDEAGCGVYASIRIMTPGDFYSFDNGASWSTSPELTGLNGVSSYGLKVRRGATCTSYVRNLTINSTYKPLPVTNDHAVTLCDAFNDGSENIDLTFYNDNIIANAANFAFKYYNTFAGADGGGASIGNSTSYNMSNANNKVYVRIISPDGCYSVATLTFTFIDSPFIYLKDLYPLCQFKSTTIDAGIGYDSYTWSTGETTQTITVTSPGTYWLVVTEDHGGGLICDMKKEFLVFLSNPASIRFTTTTDWTLNENQIVIYATGLGDYEYSIDGENYQDNNVFSNLKHGIQKIYVRDKHNCGIVNEDVFLLVYPKFFTPNDDNYNDTWKIEFSEMEPGMTITIVDRNGRLLKQLGSKMAWDGKFNGKPLPSDDYWFIVKRPNGKFHRGHFTLKR